MPSQRLNVPALFAALGGPVEIRRLLLQARIECPSLKGIEKWRERGKMSSCWLITLLYLPSLRGGKPLDVRKFIETPKEMPHD